MKKAAFVAVVAAALASLDMQAQAAGMGTQAEASFQRVGDTREAEPARGDQIEYRYRIYNGRQQYRRWNVTKKCWVDPKWIDV